jgi:mannitol/fructose-specific phosphotransferase system IIA component (Ntr-type)
LFSQSSTGETNFSKNYEQIFFDFIVKQPNKDLTHDNLIRSLMSAFCETALQIDAKEVDHSQEIIQNSD